MGGATRWLLALGVAALTLVCAEGVASLLLRRSLLRPAAEALPAERLPSPTDRDRHLAALRNPGVYRVHPDPFVGYVLRSDEQLEIAGCPVRSDALGLRVRPGPPPPQDALRVVVLGDSVAFGFGIHDDETLACRLEAALTAMRGPAARPVVARTVAIPGWNHRNAVGFLLDHYSELRPDIVVYLPIGNDLCDTDGVWESGQRRAVPDLANPDPLLSVRTNAAWPFMRPMREEFERIGKAALVERLGPNVTTADLSPESQRRYDENVASILALQQQLETHGGHLLLLQYEESKYNWHLQRRLAQAQSTIPIVPMFDGVGDALSLPTDPHPNALAVQAMAQWVAEDLVARGWIDGGERRPLPAVAPVAAERRARARTGAEFVKQSDALRAEARAALQPVVDWRDATGLNQVYGTINGDGSVGPRLLMALAPGGGTLALELQALPQQPDLYPLTVQVAVDGQRLEPLVLTYGDSVRWRLPLPPRAHPDAPLEVLLSCERWAVQDAEGSASMATFRPLRIACEL